MYFKKWQNEVDLLREFGDDLSEYIKTQWQRAVFGWVLAESLLCRVMHVNYKLYGMFVKYHTRLWIW